MTVEFDKELGFGIGNPGVSQGYPRATLTLPSKYPYPLSQVQVFEGWGHGYQHYPYPDAGYHTRCGVLG